METCENSVFMSECSAPCEWVIKSEQNGEKEGGRERKEEAERAEKAES